MKKFIFAILAVVLGFTACNKAAQPIEYEYELLVADDGNAAFILVELPGADITSGNSSAPWVKVTGWDKQTISAIPDGEDEGDYLPAGTYPVIYLEIDDMDFDDMDDTDFSYNRSAVVTLSTGTALIRVKVVQGVSESDEEWEYSDSYNVEETGSERDSFILYKAAGERKQGRKMIHTVVRSDWNMQPDLSSFKQDKNKRLVLEGFVNVTGSNVIWDLPEGAEYVVRYGIHVPEGSALTIRGKGKLTVEGYPYCSAIGGFYKETSDKMKDIFTGKCGSITIQGGDIILESVSGGAAALGNCLEGSGAKIFIEGGSLKVTAGAFAPGIGTGRKGGDAQVTVSGGTIDAKGGSGAPGIGCGAESKGKVEVTFKGSAKTRSYSKSKLYGLGNASRSSDCTINLNSTGISREFKLWSPKIKGEINIDESGMSWKAGGKYFTPADVKSDPALLDDKDIEPNFMS